MVDLTYTQKKGKNVEQYINLIKSRPKFHREQRTYSSTWWTVVRNKSMLIIYNVGNVLDLQWLSRLLQGLRSAFAPLYVLNIERSFTILADAESNI